MDHITIPIPEGLPADQKRDLAGYLTDQVKEITGDQPAIDDDPQARAEIVRRIQRGLDEIEAGRGVGGREALGRIAERHGLTTPE